MKLHRFTLSLLVLAALGVGCILSGAALVLPALLPVSLRWAVVQRVIARTSRLTSEGSFRYLRSGT